MVCGPQFLYQICNLKICVKPFGGTLDIQPPTNASLMKFKCTFQIQLCRSCGLLAKHIYSTGLVISNKDTNYKCAQSCLAPFYVFCRAQTQTFSTFNMICWMDYLGPVQSHNIKTTVYQNIKSESHLTKQTQTSEIYTHL